MKPSGNSKIGFAGLARSSSHGHGGSTPVLRPNKPKSPFAASPSNRQTEPRGELSPPFLYDGMRLGAAEQSACETWDGGDRPTWKDLILSARVNRINGSAWSFNAGETTSSAFVYEGVPLGEEERRTYEQWAEPAQPSWEELVISARIEELNTLASIPNACGRCQTDQALRADASKRKREDLINQKKTFLEPFEYDGMRLGSPERAACKNWSKPHPPTSNELIIEGRLRAISNSTWHNELDDSSIFEYEGMPLGQGERLAYEKWLEPAQPGWEDLVVDARIAELAELYPSASTECEHGRFEEGEDVPLKERVRTFPVPIIAEQEVGVSFLYDGVALGAAERAAYDRWSKPDRPNWDDLILDAHQTAVEHDGFLRPAIGEATSSVFLYEGMSLGNAEREAYGRWRQPAQPRWQNLVVNARQAELDPSAWILDEHDPFEDSEAAAFPAQATRANTSQPALDNQPVSHRPGFATGATRGKTHDANPSTGQPGTRRTLCFESSGRDVGEPQSVEDRNCFYGVGKVRRLGAKSYQRDEATTYSASSSTKRLSPDIGRCIASSSPPKKAVVSKVDNIGTYGSRKNERVRLATETGKYESEHIFGFKVVHDILRSTKEGRRLERPMPAYLECKSLHRQHVGTGKGRNRLVGRGWSDDASYRSDQRATLSDPVASEEGVAASNGYQLNQLGYAHQLANGGLQSETPAEVIIPLQIATTSYNYTVSRDPVLLPPTKEQSSQLLHLGPRGQTEALLARETALTGKWPTREREQQVYREFLALHAIKKDLEAKPISSRKKKAALVSALNRTAGLIARPYESWAVNRRVENRADKIDQPRTYDPRDHRRDESFGR
uniref:VirD5 n=1 Tax=Agrobacterium tumefaciens TaxID=358 RepID=Q8VT84_AGRTU|nr:VirD5 [Agrobacterium tumefaciens]